MSDLDAQTVAYDVYSSTCGDNTDVVAIYENPINELYLPHDQCHVNAWLGGPPC